MSAENATPEAPKKSKSAKMLLGGFISFVVIAETLIFFLLVPSADDVAALAEQRLVERLESKMKADNEEVIDDSQSIEEFPLGDFSIPVKPSGTEDKYNLDFTLFGTVKKKDISTLEKLFKAREGRFRNRLQLEIRNASIDELTEAQLGLIQRRILATTNEILEDPLIVGVGFKQYQLFME